MKSSQADDDPIETGDPDRLTQFMELDNEMDLTLFSNVKFIKMRWLDWCMGEIARGKSGGHQARQIVYETDAKGRRTGRIALARSNQ